MFDLAKENANHGLGDVKSLFSEYITRRSTKEPYAYIARKVYFYECAFHVDHNTLIPRPDTETLVESTIDLIQSKYNTGDCVQPFSFLELGIGSGAIILSVMNNLRNNFKSLDSIKFIGTDISSKAIQIALKNAESLHLKNYITFLENDWIDNLDLESFDIIVSNPPYIKKDIVDTLDSSVKELVQLQYYYYYYHIFFRKYT